MKIACFTDAYLPGINGVAFSIDVFSRLLSKEGNAIEIYAPALEHTTRVESHDGITVRRFYSVPVPTYKEVHVAIPDAVKIYNQIEKLNPDIIHIHTPGTLGLAGLLMAKMLKKPVVGTYHTLISEMLVYASFSRLLEKYLGAIDKAINGVGLDLGVLGVKDGNEKAIKESISQKITWSLVNRVYGYCDTVLCPSEAIKRELVKRGVKKRIEVVSNGVDLKLFPAKGYSRISGNIIHAGRLGFEKNVKVVIRAFSRLVIHHPDWRLIVAGDGPARKDLQEFCRKLGVAEQVQFLGMVPREELGAVYRSGDVFATASTMETQGMVVLEAMASGLPIVGVNRFALPDLVQDGENGFIVKPGNDRSMAEKIEEIMTDSDMMERMGKNSIEIAQEHEVGYMAKKLFRLYEDERIKKLSSKGY